MPSLTIFWVLWFSAIRQYFSIRFVHSIVGIWIRFWVLNANPDPGDKIIENPPFQHFIHTFPDFLFHVLYVCTTVFGDTNIVKAREQSSIQIREREKRNIIHICCLLRENWTNMNVNISEQRTNIPSKIFPTYLHILCHANCIIMLDYLFMYIYIYIYIYWDFIRFEPGWIWTYKE